MKRKQFISTIALILALLLLAGCAGAAKDGTAAAQTGDKSDTAADPAAPAAEPKDSGESETTEDAAKPEGTEPASHADEEDADPAETSSSSDAEPETAETQDTEPAPAMTYAELQDILFEFCSGAGAWSTELTVAADGSFSGNYHDSDMGDMGDDYPNGTLYFCSFTGRFGPLRYVDDHTCSTEIQEIVSEKEQNDTEIIDGVRYIASYPYGLEDAETLYFYLPGKPVDELPESFRDWCRYQLEDCTDGKLNFYGLYNEAMEEGFYSYEAGAFPTERELILESYEAVSARSDEIDRDLNEADLDQQSMNELEYENFAQWDALLNRIWTYLKDSLDKDEMKSLTQEELKWIADKEAAVAEAGEEFEGGSMQHFVMAGEAVRWTKERVTVLIDRYLKD